MSKINNEYKNINKAIFSALKESDEVPYADDVNAESLSEEYMRRYKVSFYVDTDSMNNMDIEEKVEAILRNSGLASTDETIEVEQLSELEEEVLNEVRKYRRLHRGDEFKNPNGIVVTIVDVDEENLLDGEPQVTYQFSDRKDYLCHKQSSVVDMLNQNRYTYMHESALTEEDTFQDFQNEWNDLVKSINNVRVNTRKAKELQTTLTNYCNKVIQDIYKNAMNSAN